MVVTERRTGSPAISAGMLLAPPYRYTAYDLCVQSDLPLPFADEQPSVSTAPQMIIRCRRSSRPPMPDGLEVVRQSCAVHGVDMTEHRGPGGIWLWLRSLGTFHITPDARRMDVYPDPEVDDRSLGLLLLGPLLLFMRHKRGLPTLHASAVIERQEAIVFLGNRGQGKSTIAASFLHRSASLLTDDVLPLILNDGVVAGVPGPPYMRLWRETVEQTLELQDDLPNLAADVEKKLLALDGRYRIAAGPVRLHALYLLDRFDPVERGSTDVTIRRLGARDALFALLAQTYTRPYVLPSEDALSLPIYTRLIAQAPVHLLSYPSGFHYQDAVRARIQEHLEIR